MTATLLRPLAEADLIERFYFVADDHGDVVRLLADAQDLSTMLADVAHE